MADVLYVRIAARHGQLRHKAGSYLPGTPALHGDARLRDADVGLQTQGDTRRFVRRDGPNGYVGGDGSRRGRRHNDVRRNGRVLFAGRNKARVAGRNRALRRDRQDQRRHGGLRGFLLRGRRLRRGRGRRGLYRRLGRLGSCCRLHQTAGGQQQWERTSHHFSFREHCFPGHGFPANSLSENCLPGRYLPGGGAAGWPDAGESGRLADGPPGGGA